MPLKCETNLLQDITEFNQFIKLIMVHEVTSYLEIGSKHGGSFWRISTALPKGSRVVSVDLPHGDGSFKNSEPNLKACVAELKRRGYDAHLFLSDSTNAQTVERVRSLSPFDLVFIDGNHTAPYVRADWKNYGPMSNMVAFHDIGYVPLEHKDPKKLPIDVPGFWKELKSEHEHVEIRNCAAANGIGVLWRTQS